jgi:hypothetical protein
LGEQARLQVGDLLIAIIVVSVAWRGLRIRAFHLFRRLRVASPKEYVMNARTTTVSMSELPTEERTRCEVWTRVMGYHRPVSAFNAGKRAEHAERCYFREVAEKPRS